MHDIIFISANKDTVLFKEFKKKYPFAKQASSYTEAKTKSFTKLFWLVWDDVVVCDDFDFKFTIPEWDHQYIHVFKNGEYFDGLCLSSKDVTVSEREFKHRFFINKKEIDIQASVPLQYEIFKIDTYDEYLSALKTSVTDMFWCVWNNIKVLDDTIFKMYFSYHNSYDRNENHVFKNLCNDKESFINGIVLLSKNKVVSKREFDHKFLIHKKEYDHVASRYAYPTYQLTTYDDYLEILKTESQPMFWGIWNNIDIINFDIFDMYFDPFNGEYDYDRSIHHVFKNACHNKESYLNGVVLFSSSTSISKTEFTRKFPINKKEHDIVATRFRYPIYHIDNYEEYQNICATETQPLFWCVWPEIEITDNSIFDLYFDPLDGAYDYDRTENHVFQNQDIGEIKYNGLMLMSTATPVSKKEINFRYIVVKKEHNVLVSKLKLYDIVFISYYEPNAEENYLKLTTQFPNRVIHRVTNVTGIHQAHIAAARLSTTPMFWVVDADAIIVDDFKFDLLLPKYDRDSVFVWKSRNPINNLEYGYGGVKLLPTSETLQMDVTSTDMTTSISDKFNAMPAVSNITAFNTDPFNTWKSAFRECVKLASRSIQGQVDEETRERLNIWCTLSEDTSYGYYAYSGALAGKAYGQENAATPAALSLINNFEWLQRQFTRQQTRLPLEISQQ